MCTLTVQYTVVLAGTRPMDIIACKKKSSDWDQVISARRGRGKRGSGWVSECECKEVCECPLTVTAHLVVSSVTPLSSPSKKNPIPRNFFSVGDPATSITRPSMVLRIWAQDLSVLDSVPVKRLWSRRYFTAKKKGPTENKLLTLKSQVSTWTWLEPDLTLPNNALLRPTAMMLDAYILCNFFPLVCYADWDTMGWQRCSFYYMLLSLDIQNFMIVILESIARIK
jgi:hypothetical protein